MSVLACFVGKVARKDSADNVASALARSGSVWDADGQSKGGWAVAGKALSVGGLVSVGVAVLGGVAGCGQAKVALDYVCSCWCAVYGAADAAVSGGFSYGEKSPLLSAGLDV